MMDRREFMHRSALFAAAGMLGRPSSLSAAAELPRFRVRRLTTPPNHHFFGYYGMCPWNASGSLMVALESTFHHRLPEAHEPAIAGRVDPESGSFTPVGETHAWNLQQGALLHWNPLNAEDEVIFNDRLGSEQRGAILDVRTGR